MKNMQALVAEFIGTFALIFVGVSAIAADYMTKGSLGLTGIALAHGLTIAVMVSATAATSGGHLNPAVTFGAMVGGKIKVPLGLMYMAAQCLGALVAAFFTISCIPAAALIETSMGTPLPGAGITVGQALLMETILTFFLAFVVYGTAIDARAHKVGGLFIGLTVALDIMAGGPISGGAMNPARHFGPAVFGGHFDTMWLYWVGPLLGGGLAGMLYPRVLEKKR